MNHLRPMTLSAPRPVGPPPPSASPSVSPAPAGSVRQVESLTGRGRVTLAPGHSLMDWIRLGRDKGDLSGVGGKKREVTVAELAAHNTERDLWMAIRGKVYNMTPYLDFHPGGVDELMRAAGVDGTNLFDEVHNWVNAESMMTKCYIGPLVTADCAFKTLPKAMRHRQSLGSVQSRRASDCPEPRSSWKFYLGVCCRCCCRCPLAKCRSIEHYNTGDPTDIDYDWYQTNEEVVIAIYTRSPNFKSEQVIVDISASEVFIEALIRDNSYFIHFKPHGKLEESCSVHVVSEKAEVKLKKKQEKSQWSSLGNKLNLDKAFIRTKNTEPKYRHWLLMSNLPVTHDTRLLALKPPPGTRMMIPIGYHMHVHHKVKGMELARSYTVVLPSLLKDSQDPGTAVGKVIHFMIKAYDGGAISPWITSLKPGDKIQLDRYDGNFNLQRLHSASHLIMFAAGTGFTSMIRLIYHALHEMPDSSIHVRLVFYNKTPDDILWSEQLEMLERNYNDRFSVTHVLSRATNDTWNGLTGRVTLDHVTQFVPQVSQDCNPLLCICGMHAFNEAVESFAKIHGLQDEHIHIFTQTT